MRNSKTENMPILAQIEQKNLPFQFLEYVNSKIKKNLSGGRPHFLELLAARKQDPKDELLNICERAWIKNLSLTKIAKDYDTSGKTLYRLLKDLEPLKEEIAEYVKRAPRRKHFFLRELESSDYETVQNYIQRAKREGLKTFKEQIQIARHTWSALDYQDPQYWTADQICQYLSTLSQGSQSRALDAIRQVAPQIAIRGSRDQVQTGRFREKLSRRKKDIFGKEVHIIHRGLERFHYLKTIFDLHITLGAREGAQDPRSGLAGLTWDKFKDRFTKVDLYESKIRGGITWRDCPLDLFFKDLPRRLEKLWISRGKPPSDRVLLNGYRELGQIYKAIRAILSVQYQGKVDPSLLKEFSTLRPHDADKIHVNLLWEAEIPLEVVAGQYIGKNEGIGLMGRGWLDINVIKKHYLSLTSRCKRMKKLQRQVREYSALLL